MAKNKTGLKKELSELREKRRELGVKIGGMSHNPKSDPSYSSAKMENMQREMDKFDEEISELEGKLLDLAGAAIEPPNAPASKSEPAPRPTDIELEARTKKAAKEIAILTDRCDKRALDITREVYKLVDLCRATEDDWQAAVALVHVNPDELSCWQIQQSFPMVTLLKDLITVQRRIMLVKPELLEKTGLPPVW
jgi:seryl-tRNA synthetase